jgi:hypothetical protein
VAPFVAGLDNLLRAKGGDSDFAFHCGFVHRINIQGREGRGAFSRHLLDWHKYNRTTTKR